MQTSFNWPVFYIAFTISMIYYLRKAWRAHCAEQQEAIDSRHHDRVAGPTTTRTGRRGRLRIRDAATRRQATHA